MDLDMIAEIGAVLVALIITSGVVVLAVQGKPTDGLEAGFLAVLGFYFGGSLAKSAATRAVGKAKEAIESVQNGQVASTAAASAAQAMVANAGQDAATIAAKSNEGAQ